MIRVLQLKVHFLVFICTTFSSVGQDILYLKDGSEKRIVFDSEDANSLTYRDYDDPDFKQVTEKKKLYSKVVLANGKTVWLSQRDNYFRCKLGINIGMANTLGDFASNDSSNANAGFASGTLHASANLDVNIYKFVGIRAMIFSTDGSLSNDGYWNNWGYAIGPEFHIKLFPRFYASVPILFQGAKMSTENETYSYNTTTSGDGTGMGFVTGLGIHARLGQHMAVGLTSQYFKQNMAMTFNQHYYVNNLPSMNYSGDYKWSYLTTAATFTIHF